MQTVPRRRPDARSASRIFQARRALAAPALLVGAMATAMPAASPAAALSRSTAFPVPPLPAENAPRLAPPFAALAPPSSPGLSIAGETAIDRRIEGLRGQLAITPPQMPLWTAFAHSIRENAQSAIALSAQRAGAMPAMSAADNLHDYARLAHAYADNLERLAAVFDRLYAQLSPAQRRIADAVFRQPSAIAVKPGR